MSIIVTEIDITSGRIYNAYSGPLALAMTRAYIGLGRSGKIGVGFNTWWKESDPWEEFNLPMEAIAFRRLHNDRKKVHPFMFQVEDEC